MKSILHPDFKYVPAAETDLRRTFARVRKELAADKANRERAVVQPITRKAAK
jgi:hypothetical protein